MAAQKRQAFQDNIPGGNYTAVRETDGTWTVKDVPIFAELPAGMRENEAKVSTRWMEAAIDRHNMLETQQGHLPPCHIAHHDMGQDTQKLGFFRIHSIRPIMQEGAEVPALFADILGLNDESLEKIKNRELPYRSVEIVEWERPEFASLALLADESPFFKMEMLSIGEEILNTNLNPQASEPLVAMSGGNTERAALLFSFKGRRKMSITEKLKEKFSRKFQDDDKKKDDDDDKDDDKKFQDEGKDEDNGDDNGKGVDIDGDGDNDIQLQEVTDDVAGQIAAMIAEFQESIPSMIQEYLDGINPLGGSGDVLPGEEEELIPEAEPEFDIPPAEAPVDLELEAVDDENPFEPEDEEEPMRLGGRRGMYRDNQEKDMKQFAQMAGRVAALENQNNARAKVQKLTGVVDRAVAILREAGWDVPKSAIKTMRELARDSRTPGKTVKAFAKSYMRHSPKDPAKTLEELTTQRAGESEDVMKFAAKGPETLERARLLGREYTELKDSGFNWSCSMADHIEAHIEGE